MVGLLVVFAETGVFRNHTKIDSPVRIQATVYKKVTWEIRPEISGQRSRVSRSKLESAGNVQFYAA